ncbi:MAG: hypothetical protein SPE22_05675, partial [Dialister sp.]|nr:hypothetical protein [Dialister sp.]
METLHGKLAIKRPSGIAHLYSAALLIFMRRTTIPHSDKAFIHNQRAARPLSQPIESIFPSEGTI